MTMLTGKNMSTGTLPYMAPEQLSKKFGRINEQTDVWGIGATMYHLLSGEPPFETDRQILDVDEEPYELEEVSENIREIVSGCLTKDRKKRFKNINEILKKAGIIVETVKSEPEIILKKETKPLIKSNPVQTKQKGDLSIITNVDCSINLNGKQYKTNNKYLYINDVSYGNILIKAENDSFFNEQDIIIDKKLTKLSLELKQKMANLFAKSKIGEYELKINEKTYSCPEFIEQIPFDNYEIEIVFNKKVYIDNIDLNKTGTVEYELTEEKLTSIEKKPIVRSPYLDHLSDEQVKKILKTKGFYDSNWNKNGDFKNDFKTETIDGDLVITDKSTNLMWHQSGSQKEMNWSKAKEWVVELNKKGYAGYSDWRLPTLEEGASLLTKKKKFFGLYVDDIFHKKQKWIWTGDSFSSERAWYVDFYDSFMGLISADTIAYVRPVRLWQ